LVPVVDAKEFNQIPERTSVIASIDGFLTDGSAYSLPTNAVPNDASGTGDTHSLPWD